MPFLETLSPETLALGAAALFIVVAAILTSVLALAFAADRARLPLAVFRDGLEGEIAAKEARRNELDQEILELQRTLAAGEQAEAEAEHWRSLIEGVKAEWAGLAEQRQEIESVREEERKAVEALGARETAVSDAEARLDAAEKRRRQLEEEIKEVERKHGASLEEQERRLREIEEQIGTRRSDLNGAKFELDQAEQALAAANGNAARAREEAERLRTEVDALSRDLTVKQAYLARCEEALAAREPLVREVDSLRDILVDLQSQRDALQAEAEFKEREVETLRRQEVRLSAAIADLEASRSGLAGAAGAGAEDDDQDLTDLLQKPDCLKIGDWASETLHEREELVLDRLHRSLHDAGLLFPPRVLHAFHTSLKTSVVSPLTVLAGISGTGKSQLPRRYAEAMGMHFLKIAVQPRWDSPQDLFGFYNYLEKRYKATDLARAMVRLDRFNWPNVGATTSDRVLMVLLDEMNLARIEYYFSEFLSRLEGRPFDEDNAPPKEREPANLTIDIQRTKEGSRSVYPVQNVLFVGTMNEDESTLSLSDKVLDRANVLRFGKPGELRANLPEERQLKRASGYLSRQRWLSWVRRYEKASISMALCRDAEKIVEDINDVLARMHRPFGHRMIQAILHYMANYPRAGSLDAMQHALADQLELRILPKLRGLDTEHFRQQLEELAQIAQRLNDRTLAGAIRQAVEEGEGAGGTFVWRGVHRDA